MSNQKYIIFLLKTNYLCAKYTLCKTALQKLTQDQIENEILVSLEGFIITLSYTG